MKTHKSKTILHGMLAAATLLTSIGSVFAATNYYVDPVNGNNSNTGLSVGTGTNGPFRSVQKAVDVASPGDTILLRGGVYRTPTENGNGEYRQVVRTTKSGTPTAPINIVPYMSEKPILKASERVTGWEEIVETNDLMSLGFDADAARHHVWRRTVSVMRSSV